MKRFLLIQLFFLSLVSTAIADGTRDNVENQYSYRTDLDFQVKLYKGLNMNFGPELRFSEGFDKFIINGGFTYKTLGCLYVGASYRLTVDRIEGSTSTYYNTFGGNFETETSHRYSFDLKYQDKFGRFTPSFRLRYSNFTEDEYSDDKFLRYRAKVDYDIRKCKVTPYVSVELYQELNDMMLHKMRYAAGAEYKVNKKSSFNLNYKLDFFTLKYQNTHIIAAGFKHKFN